MSEVPVVRIRSTHPESQGDFVEINAEDFDPMAHEEYRETETVEIKRGPGRPRKSEA